MRRQRSAPLPVLQMARAARWSRRVAPRIACQARFWGASLLICTMIGAIYSHAKIGEGAGEMIPPGVLLVLCAVVAWAACPFCRKTVTMEASPR